MTSKPEMFTNAQVRLLETIARGLGARDKEEAIIHLLGKHPVDSWILSNGASIFICKCQKHLPNEQIQEYNEHLIALIKGENK